MLSVKGIFRKGTAFPIEKVDGRENQQVIITFLKDDETGVGEEGDWNDLIQLVEASIMETGVEDLAHQHDHHLYGAPKKDE